jgi:hypothetical protein
MTRQANQLKQVAEHETAQPQRLHDRSSGSASANLIAHALAGAFIGFLNSWIRKGQPLSAGKGRQFISRIRLGRDNKCANYERLTKINI